MIQTTKKHWVNGYQRRWAFKSLAMSFGSYAICFYWGHAGGKRITPYYHVYKLN